MRTPRLFLGIFALALPLPLLLSACGGSDEPTGGKSSERATAGPTEMPNSERAADEPTGLPDSERATGEPEGNESSGPTAPEPTTASAEPSTTLAATTAPPLARTSTTTDREALIAHYNATGGPTWTYNDNWLSDAPTTEWYGVTTDLSTDRVTSLGLRNNELSGETLSELGNLASLTELTLHENQLSGGIPPELGNLASLIVLFLEGNQLSGCVSGSLEDRLDFEYSGLGDLPFC